jgi:hypothetical protein
MYPLIGSKTAILIDDGDVADANTVPLAAVLMCSASPTSTSSLSHDGDSNTTML